MPVDHTRFTETVEGDCSIKGLAHANQPLGNLNILFKLFRGINIIHNVYFLNNTLSDYLMVKYR